MKIQILGSGCPNCKKLEANTIEAIKAMGIEAEIEKVTDIDKIMEFGVMMTPGFVVDGTVKSVGKVLKKEQIIQILRGGK